MHESQHKRGHNKATRSCMELLSCGSINLDYGRSAGPAALLRSIQLEEDAPSLAVYLGHLHAIFQVFGCCPVPAMGQNGHQLLLVYA
jgi:hypothetical protein